VKRSTLFKLVLSVPLAAAVGLLISAIGERLVDPTTAFVGFDLKRPDFRLLLTTRSGTPLVDRTIGLRLAVDPFSSYRNLPGQRSPSYVIDERGFRRDVEAIPVPSTFVLGGSAAFGQGLNPGESPFSALLQEKHPDLKCVNAAVVGFVSSQELAELIHRLDRYRPSLYIVFDGWNDLFDAWTRVLGRSPTEADLEVYGGFVQIENQLLACSRAASGTVSGTVEDVSPRVESPLLGESEFFNRVIENYVNNLEKMTLFARARGADVLVVFQPELGQKVVRSMREESQLEFADRSYAYLRSGFPERYARLVETARRRCDQLNIRYIDLVSSGVFVESSEELFKDTVHINRRGHQLVAESILDHLASSGSASAARR
jgi:lysophospholipase L1-like esterase